MAELRAIQGGAPQINLAGLQERVDTALAFHSRILQHQQDLVARIRSLSVKAKRAAAEGRAARVVEMLAEAADLEVDLLDGDCTYSSQSSWSLGWTYGDASDAFYDGISLDDATARRLQRWTDRRRS